MPKLKGKKKEEEEEAYMPGMKEKKKKGFLSLFSRKKGAKFDVVSVSVYDSPVLRTLQGYLSMLLSIPLQAVEHSNPPANRRSMAVTTDSPAQRREKALSKMRPQSEIIPHSSAPVASSSSIKTTPIKPPRKKRQAPLPPPAQTETLKVDVVNNIHSRNSSHSSGYGEGSPAQSPESGVHEEPPSHVSVDVMSVGSGEKDKSADDSTLSRSRKKRRAPAPPGKSSVWVTWQKLQLDSLCYFSCFLKH